jgi:hypothetical protein
MAVWVLYGALFAAAILGGLLPLVMGNIAELWQLLFMYLPSLGLAAFPGVRILTAATLLHRPEASRDAWENLILTSVNAHQIVIGKWLAMMQTIKRDYLLLALVRGMAAYGLSVYFYFNSAWNCLPGLNAFCYVLRPAQQVSPLPYLVRVPLPVPSLFFCALALATLILFALLELGLVSAIGVWMAFSARRRLSNFQGVSVRALLAGIAFAVLIGGNQIQSAWWQLYYIGTRNILSTISVPPFVGVAIVETIQSAVSPVLDGGTLMSTNFLRIYTTTTFLLRHMLAVVTGMLTFALLIWLLVRASVRLAVRRGAAPLTLNP